MKISIAGRHMDVGQSLEEHTHARLEGMTQYFTQVNDADVTFRHGNEGNHKAEVTIHASGVTLRATGSAKDNFFAAIDDAAEKLETQLKRYKGRLKKHRERRENSAAKFEAFQTISTVHQVVEESQLDEVPVDFAEYVPKVVKKDVQSLQAMTVDEAVMHMDLLHAPFFAFQNITTGDINVVYRKYGNEDDDTVVWVEPHKPAATQAA